MKPVIRLISYIFLVILTTCNPAPAETAEYMIKKAWQSYRSLPHEMEYVSIAVTKEGGQAEKKKLTRWIKFMNNGSDNVVRGGDGEICLEAAHVFAVDS